MEADLRVMDDMKNQIEKGRVNFKKSPKDRLTESYITARLEGLEDLIQKFTKKHEDIISRYARKDLDKTSYMENDVFENGYENYLLYKGELKAMLKPIKQSQINNSDTPGGNKDTMVRLPQISIPFFSGKYTEWSSFKDLFTSLIHNNQALDDVQRLHYLKTQLKGEAEQLIRHISITDANYKVCWSLLCNRYNNKRYISNCILKRLFGQRSMNSESAQQLKELLDTTSDCMHELENMGIKIATWDIIIIYIISLKLDPETRKQWELNVNNLSEDLPSFANFKEFIESRFRALEFVESAKNTSKFKTNTSNNTNPKVLHTTTNVTCPHCNENHKLYSCRKFANEDVSSRRDIVKSLQLCFNCFGNNHLSSACRVPTKCRICKRQHHTLLHGNSSASTTVAVATRMSEIENSQAEPSTSTCETTSIMNHLMTDKVPSQTLLATALVTVESRNGHPQVLRALLDQGSQASFISEAAVQLLRLNKLPSKTSISGLGGKESGLTSKYVVMVCIQSLYDPAFNLRVKAHVLNTVTAILPGKKFVLPAWKKLGSIQLADPQYNSPNKIDMLLGSEVYCHILKKGLIKSPLGSIIAQDTYLGWVLSGQVRGYNDEEQKCHNVVVSLYVNVEEKELIKRFWEIEAEPNFKRKDVLTPEEQACEEHFKATTTRDDAGRYVVELPFRANIPHDYGDTRGVAVKRLLSLEKRLSKNHVHKEEYSKVLNEYLALNHMEKVSVDSESETVWLPHHAVIRLDKTTTQTRVVFNASDRSAKGLSLNDTLMVGPTLQPELRHIMMRWRLHPVCLVADITKMYRQVRVSKKHVDYQRIVWRDSPDQRFQDYRLLTVTFGTSCAPYLAVKVLQQVAIDEGHKYPLTADKIKTDFYMDDLITGCQSDDEALQTYREMNELLLKGGFVLQKWASNRIGLLESLSVKTGTHREFKENDITKVVGLSWNRRFDEFDYSVRLSCDAPAPETKRAIISEICRLYDPLGWISPCIIKAKIFIQKLWLTGLDWDDKIPEELLKEWHQYREALMELINFHIPRWVQTNSSDVQVELHGFSDASNAAYAAVVYIRCVSIDGEVKTHLVTAKTKVAPIKQISIPRLELCGAVLVARLLVEVSEILKIKKSDLHAWTDSTVVLAWLSDHPSRWQTFVGNRVSEIHTLLDSSQWSYVQSKENPADSASRGLTPSDLIHNNLWKNGPPWLCSDNIQYEKPRSIFTKTELEMRSVKVHTTIATNELDIFTKFSSLRKLLRVIAYCRRFLELKNRNIQKYKPLPYLTAAEIRDARWCCIRLHQSYWFLEEISNLKKGKQISQKSKLLSLTPFVDTNGILRVGGRIVNSDLPDDSKHPVIIAGECQLAKLIISDAHETTMHGGQQLTCNFIRSKYWIIRLKNGVRAHIHNCVPCIRNASKTRTQLMGQLPACRVTPQKPFLNTGVDYAGPINIRVSKGRGHKSYKGYVCLFICMATRAIHLEVVSDLTSEGFLSAFKRFVARRGRCTQLWSDNGTNFVGASKDLKKLLADERSSFSKDIAAALANNGTDWQFIPPHAPNFGGLWEAGIKSTKHHLRRVIGESTLTYEELSTVLSQVEACLNSRPLSQISPDPDDSIPLTPGHFLVGEPLLIAPDYDYENVRVHSLRRWQVTQRMVQSFWKRWSQEYLTNFFQRYKWKTKIPDLKIGDIVLVKEDNLPPARWLYGQVTKLHPGKDSLTRVVTLRYKGSEIQRPTSKLCPIPA